MGNALPVQEPTMEEILASIRRIIEGHEDARVAEPAAGPSRAKDDVAAEPTPSKIEGPIEAIPCELKDESAEAVAKPDDADEAADPTPFDHMELSQPAPSEIEAPSNPLRARLREISGPAANPLKAVNDEGRMPYGGSLKSEVEREVSSQMEEIATLSVARMRASSLEETVRSAEAASAEQSGIADREHDGTAFFDEFDETAFANELLFNAGLLPEPFNEPQSVSRAEAVTLRLAYPEAPVEEAGPEALLETAIDVATEPALALEETDAASEDDAETEVSVAAKADLPSSSYPLLSLVSGEAETKITSSFDELVEAFRADQLERMDETVRDLLQPMLGDWLEDNLPVIVERLVREEIERVARGPRRA